MADALKRLIDLHCKSAQAVSDFTKAPSKAGETLMRAAEQTFRDALTEELQAGQNRPAIAWYDPTNKEVSTNQHDPKFTPLGQVWPLVRKEAS